MTEEQVTAAKIAGKEAGKAAVHETLAALGADVSDPFELQKDFAFLRRMRRGVAAATARVIHVVLGSAAAGAVYAVWVAFKSGAR